MFQPKPFIENDLDIISELVRANPLGTLVVSSGGVFEVNHLPFVFDSGDKDSLKLRAHIPKASPLLAYLESESTPCVVVFQGANGYISPAWYETKKQHGKAVPTWNYAVAHVHGEISLVRDTAWVVQQLEDLTSSQEDNREEPWHMSDAPQDYIDQQLSFLVGVEIAVTKIEAKTKASQNQPTENRASVLSALQAEQPDSDLTKMMGDVDKRR